MVSTAQPRSDTSAGDPLLSDLIDEVSRQLESGEPVDLEAFIAAHPEQADALRLVLPAPAVPGAVAAKLKDLVEKVLEIPGVGDKISR
jgi:hypothetical protein